MFIIFGTKGRITTSSENDTLPKACPNCQSDLILKDLKRWFTLFFIPIFPFSTVDTFFHCSACESSYKQAARQALLSNNADKDKLQLEAKKLFCCTLIACMTHMANIDGEISHSEIEEIEKVKEKFTDFSSDIEDTYHQVIHSDNSEEYVYSLLRKSRELLTADAIMSIIALSAQVLLADGRIDDEEERLLKEYLLVCGIPKDMYNTIIDKLK